MPTYDYRCDSCSHEFEEFQSITAAPLETCPKCEGRVRRLISPGNGLIFKGSGFYITDYKRSNNGAPSKQDSQKETKSESKSESGSGQKESKPKDSSANS